jgi:broad specificity phosphatase PhoE
MKVVILRHATRSPSGMGDSPLNSVGLLQARKLATECLSPLGPLPTPTHLWASPKKRAQQTLTPLSETSGVALKTESRLDERHQSESMQDFTQRIRAVLAEVGQLSPAPETCVYLCTHLDWLEEAMPLIDSDMTENEMAMPFSTAEFRIFRLGSQDDQPGSMLWQLKTRGRAEER